MIRRNAFARAYNLKEINIPEGVSYIEMVAFRYCKSIESITLPSTLSFIGYLAFTDMDSLKEIHIKAKTPPTEDYSFGFRPDSPYIRGSVASDVYHVFKTNTKLYVPIGRIDAYKGWKHYFLDIIEE